LSRSAVSHHLKLLKEASVLQSEKRGKEVWFRVNKSFLLEALASVSDYIRQRT
jgi:DNA-binding transcriptional ArsR family regulator